MKGRPSMLFSPSHLGCSCLPHCQPLTPLGSLPKTHICRQWRWGNLFIIFMINMLIRHAKVIKGHLIRPNRATHPWPWTLNVCDAFKCLFLSCDYCSQQLAKVKMTSSVCVQPAVAKTLFKLANRKHCKTLHQTKLAEINSTYLIMKFIDRTSREEHDFAPSTGRSVCVAYCCHGNCCLHWPIVKFRSRQLCLLQLPLRSTSTLRR